MSLETLRIIWWLLLGMLLAGFAVTDGADLGTAALLPFVTRNVAERQSVIDSGGLVWDGKPAWFIVGGIITFAAWPALFAASLSGYYLTLFMVLVTLILRPVGFKYRSRFGKRWDRALILGGIGAPFVFGAAFGNLLLGVPFNIHAGLRLHTDFTLLSLFNPFALLCGLVSLTMIMMHGAAWLNLKCQGAIQGRARQALGFFAFAFIILSLFAGLWAGALDGYRLQTADPNAPSHVANQAVLIVQHGWQDNFRHAPILWLLPVASKVAALLAACIYRHPFTGFVASSLVPGLTIASAGTALFPFFLPSSSDPDFSLTLWNASSGKFSLEVMLGAVLLLILCGRILNVLWPRRHRFG